VYQASTPSLSHQAPIARTLSDDEHHAAVRCALEQLPRRPHAGVAAAEDHDVGGDVARRRGDRLRAARLAEPVPVGVVVH
jgi:hypothetical protein